MIAEAPSFVNSFFKLFIIAENDAEAWASRLLLEISGVDDITDNEQYVMGNAKLKQRILELRDEIELDGEYVYRLKMLLCA